MRSKPLEEKYGKLPKITEKVSKTAVRISERGIVDGWFRYKEKIVTPYGVIYIEEVCVIA